MTTWEVWAKGTLEGIAAPVDSVNVDALWAWSGAESLPRDRMSWCNPLNTTQQWPGAVDMNSVGVKRYLTALDGVHATVTTLTNGHYPVILGKLRRSIPRAQWADAAANLGTWGTGVGWIGRDFGAPPGNIGVDVAGTVGALPEAWLVDRAKELAALKAQIAALPSSGGGAVDLSPILNAIAALKASQDLTSADVAAIKRRIEKDLAP